MIPVNIQQYLVEIVALRCTVSGIQQLISLIWWFTNTHTVFKLTIGILEHSWFLKQNRRGQQTIYSAVLTWYRTMTEERRKDHLWKH